MYVWAVCVCLYGKGMECTQYPLLIIIKIRKCLYTLICSVCVWSVATNSSDTGVYTNVCRALLRVEKKNVLPFFECMMNDWCWSVFPLTCMLYIQLYKDILFNCEKSLFSFCTKVGLENIKLNSIKYGGFIVLMSLEIADHVGSF